MLFTGGEDGAPTDEAPNGGAYAPALNPAGDEREEVEEDEEEADANSSSKTLSTASHS